jgi:hypothetical protein
MRDQYHIDPEKFNLDQFKESLRSREMIPSRVSLKEDLDERFQILEDCGITNHQELMDALKAKPKIEQFSEESGLSVEYLTLLNREAKSYLPNPSRLDKFPGVDSTVVERLEAEGITNSRHLFIAAKDPTERERLSNIAGISIEDLTELVGLSDLSRAYGVGPVFARLIYDVGITSMQEFVECSAEDFIRIYEEKTQKKADFSVAEIQFSLELARKLEIKADR